MIKEITSQKLKELMEKHEDVALVDVRQPWEVKLCAIQGSMNMPLQILPDMLGELPEDKQIITICHHGSRSKQAAVLLSHCGFDKVMTLVGGIDSWAQDIEKEMKRY